MRIPPLTTPRLILRPFAEEDVDPLHRLLRQEGVLRYFPRSDPPPRDRVQRMVSGQLRHWEKYGYGLWAVESRSTGELMGRSGLQYLPETDEVEVDFLLGQPFWGQGFATEAGQAGLRYGFDELGIESIVGIVHPENKASRRVLEKLGMRLTKRTQYFGMDCYRYAIERSWYGRAKEGQMFSTEQAVGDWVDMWNSYDLSQIDELFLTDANLTYFSSEKEGVIKGIEAVREHHKGFGFVEGGKVQENKLWVEDLHTTDFGPAVIVTGIWHFRRSSGQVQRGPVTLVYVQKGDGYRLAHLNFGNYR